MPLKTATAAPDPEPQPNRRKGTFTAIELAAFLGVSRATVWRLHSAGKLPRPIRLNRAVRWDRWTIEEWVSDGCPPRDKWEANHPPR